MKTELLLLIILSTFLGTLVFTACGGDSDDVAPTQNDAAEQADNSATDLINCESNIAADVPTFYAAYFRCTDISLAGDVVVITSSNLPPHLSYYYGEGSDQFEEFDFSRGDEYRPNPNEIARANFTLRIPLNPVPSGVVIDVATVNLTTGDNTDYPLGAAGVALDGVALFNPLAAPGADIEDEKYSFDSNGGHPQQQGAYHYHAVASGSLAVLKALGLTTSDMPAVADIELYGVMCDGTVVLGSDELDGSASASDLDLQAGHTHDIVNTGGTVMLANRYHVHMGPVIGANPRGLTPEAQYYNTCDVTNR